MKYCFVMNPVAGPGISEKKIKDQLSLLNEEIDYELYLTKGIKDATRYVNEKAKEAYGEKICFIACGGDGTLNEVVDACAHKDNVYASVIPSGSGNDFVKNFGADNFTVANIVHGSEKKIDLIKVDDRYCGNVTNFGIDTAVAKNVNNNRDKRGHGSSLDYPLGVLKALRTSMKTKCQVIADGELLTPDGAIISSVVCNGQYVGGSYHCAPRAKVDDGLMEICVIKPVSLLTFALLIGKYQKGQHLDDEKILKYITYRQAKKVEVIAEDGFEYTNDGEIIASSHFTCEIDEKALNFIVPEGAK